MNTELRTTASRARDEVTGAFYLQGVETTTFDVTNVFGSGAGDPLTPDGHKSIYYEAEIRFAFAARADDDKLDYGEVFPFRLWVWKLTEDGAEAEVWLTWQDFIGDDAPGGEYGWDALLRAGVNRMRRARSERQIPAPVRVGAP